MTPWSKERAWQWYNNQPWMVGPNYTPSYASNQLEFWSQSTFDPATIDRELTWAQQIGVNTVRVFLHHIPYEQDPVAFLNRVDQFLRIADSHGIRTILVLHDDVWNPDPVNGPVDNPHPLRILSNWVQCPGTKGLHDIHMQNGILKDYVEQEASDKEKYTLAYMTKVFEWARAVNPCQPITASLFVLDAKFAKYIGEPMEKFQDINSFLYKECDILNFHAYEPLPRFKEYVRALQKHGRPLVCTEFMARTLGSTIPTIMPYGQQANIGMIHWGFVNGRCNDIYPWDSWNKEKPYTTEPKLWFHCILHKDGRPYIKEEIDLYKALTGTSNAKL